MGIFDRFSSSAVASKLSTSKTGQLEAAEPQSNLAGLDLRQVLDAHVAWKGRLQKVLDGTSTEHFDIAKASEDCHCFLGKWIYGEGKSMYGRLPEFESVRSAHAAFHACAGKVLAEHMLGNGDEATHLLSTKFRSASNRNQLELVRLFTAARR